MSNINNVVISGRLTRDAEVKELTNTKVANFTVASNYVVKSKDSNSGYETKADFINVKRFGSNIDWLVNLLNKGAEVVVQWSIKTDTYEVEGVKKYNTYILANQIQVSGWKKEGNNDNSNTEEISSSDDVSVEEMPF